MALPKGYIELTPELEKRLREFLDPEHQTEPLFNLVRAGLAAHEAAFNHPDGRKENLLKVLGLFWIMGASGKSNPLIPDDSQPSLLTEMFRNLETGINATYKHAAMFPNTKEAFFKFVSGWWDAGVHQTKTHGMQVEGPCMNSYGVVCSLAADVAVFGANNGLLPEEALAA